MTIRAAQYVSRLSNYLYCCTRAFEAGVPFRQLPTIRYAPNLLAALPRLGDRPRIVDVGAHRGEWGEVCARLFPRGQVLSVEPVPAFFYEAERRSHGFRNWRVLNAGAGDAAGVLPMDVRGQRSSMRVIAGHQYLDWTEATPPSNGVEMVRVDTLDRLLAEHGLNSIDLLKIDTEGYEREILIGAPETLARTRQILIEVRFYELFERAPLFNEIHERLSHQGFLLMHLKPCTGTCLWADATYVANARSASGA